MGKERKKDTPRPLDGPPLLLSIGLAIKLGKFITHVDEYLSPGGHEFDRAEIQQMLTDPEIRDWLSKFPKVLLPVKRSE